MVMIGYTWLELALYCMGVLLMRAYAGRVPIYTEELAKYYPILVASITWIFILLWPLTMMLAVLTMTYSKLRKGK